MPEASLSCYVRQETASPILSLEGTLDIANAPRAQVALQEFFVEHGPEIVVDTSRLDFIDSRGLGALLNVAKAARDAGGAVYLPQPALPVRKILETCGLTTLFPENPAANRKSSAKSNGTGDEADGDGVPRKKAASRSTASRTTRTAAKSSAGD